MSDIESLHWRMADGADSYSVHAFNAEAKLFIVKRGVLKKYLETNLAPTTVRKKRFKDGKVRIPNVEVGDFLFVRSQSDFIPAGWTRLFVGENHMNKITSDKVNPHHWIPEQIEVVKQEVARIEHHLNEFKGKDGEIFMTPAEFKAWQRRLNLLRAMLG